MRSPSAARLLCACAALLCSALWSPAAHASSVVARNIVELMNLAEAIVVADVSEVRDGLTDTGVPFTEVSLEVHEALKGNAPKRYAFRQFGLLEPRTMPDGRVNLMVTPDGWPRYKAGESVVLFLYKPASQTGLRTTVGLMQGKFSIRDGAVENIVANRGLFRGVRADRSRLSEPEAKLLDHATGPVGADAFLSFVRKTVRNRWIEQGVVESAR